MQAAPGVGCTAGRLQGRDGGRGPGRLRDIGLGVDGVLRTGVCAADLLCARES